MELLVEKRDGRLVPYVSSKIISAVNRACHEVDVNMDIGSSIENVVHSRIKLEYIKSNESPVSVECIQDIVEEELMGSHPKVARVYIRYRYDREKVRTIKPKSLVNSYVDNLDWRVKENASVSYSLGGMILNNSGAVTANYWLNEVYTPDIADAHKSAQFHIHDLSMLSTYCVGHNLLDLIKKGLSGVHGKITSAPAKHLSTLCNQMVNFLGCFTDDMHILLSDGTSMSIRDMLDSGKSNWSVKSFDPDTGNIVDAELDNLHKTRTVDEYIELIFEDGTVIKCTKDHNFYTMNRGWVEADDLCRGDDLITSDKRIMHLWTSVEVDTVVDVYCGTVNNDSHMLLVGDGMGSFVVASNCLQNESAGAQAFSSVDTYLAPYVKIDNLDYDEVYQCIQSLIYGLNVPSRWGTQAPFSNFTLDLVVPRDLMNENCWVGNKQVDFKYKDCQKEMDLINEVLIDIFEAGDANGRGFAYPIPTYSITKDFDWDSTVAKKLFKLTGKYGVPYFQNFINSDLSPSDVRSMCPLHESTNMYYRVCVGNDIITDYAEIGYIARNYFNDVIEVEYLGDWKKAKLVKIDPTDTVKLTYTGMDGIYDVIMGINHLQPVLRDGTEITVKAREIRKSDKLPVKCSNTEFKYVDILNIECLQNDGKYLYCVEIIDGRYRDEDPTKHLFVVKDSLITHNCRLRLDKRELFKKGGGLFGAAEQTGSVGVVTINLPQLAYLSNGDLDNFYTRLDSLLELAKKSLVIKRSLIKKLMSQGFYPYSKAYIKTLDTHFNTIGINGCHEAILNFTKGKYGIESDYGIQFAKDLLSYINDKLADFQEETGDLFNLEASPAEGVSNRFAMHDKHNYPDIITSGTAEKPYYTNSTWLPANYGDDIFNILDHQDPLQTLYTGGTVLHVYLGESVDDEVAVARFIKSVFTNYKLPYLTISPTYSVCDIHGYIKGEHRYCPHCRDEELDKINKRINRLIN